MRRMTSRSRLLLAVLFIVVGIVFVARGPSHPFAQFDQQWNGHDRGLSITAIGRGVEQINSGCCPPSFVMTFRLSHPRVTRGIAAATLTVTSVHAPPGGSYAVRRPLPKVGQVGTVTVENGVLEEPLTGTDYCTSRAENAGKCGA